MSKETVHNLANTVVIQKEAEDLNQLVGDYNKAIGNCQYSTADKLVSSIITEKKRLNPTDKFDEEEVAVARIVRRRK